MDLTSRSCCRGRSPFRGRGCSDRAETFCECSAEAVNLQQHDLDAEGIQSRMAGGRQGGEVELFCILPSSIAPRPRWALQAPAGSACVRTGRRLSTAAWESGENHKGCAGTCESYAGKASRVIRSPCVCSKRLPVERSSLKEVTGTARFPKVIMLKRSLRTERPTPGATHFARIPV